MQTTASNGSPMLLKFIDVYNCNDVKGSNFIQYKYDFKNGLLTSPDNFGDVGNILQQQELSLTPFFILFQCSIKLFTFCICLLFIFIYL